MKAGTLILILTLGLSLKGFAERKGENPLSQKGQWVDLTHDFSEETPYWPTADGFSLTSDYFGTTGKGYFYASNTFRASEHGGTHIDAPIHFAREGRTVDQIPLDRLIGPGILIDVSGKALENPDYLVGIKDFKSWEGSFGRIPDGSIVLLNTGYHQLWPDRLRYMGTAERGAGAVAKLHFPGLGPEAAKWLMEERSISAIGIDTASIDKGQSKLFQSHRLLLGNNIPAFENVAALDLLPPKGFTLIALPMKIKGGSGGPLRIIAFIPE